MLVRRPLIIGNDLSVRIPGAEVRLTPRQGFEVGADLMRASVRRMAVDEVARAKAKAKSKRKSK